MVIARFSMDRATRHDAMRRPDLGTSRALSCAQTLRGGVELRGLAEVRRIWAGCRRHSGINAAVPRRGRPGPRWACRL